VGKSAYVSVFAERAAEFLLQLPKRRQRQVAELSRQLAAQPNVCVPWPPSLSLGRSAKVMNIEASRSECVTRFYFASSRAAFPPSVPLPSSPVEEEASDLPR
jgi:hypothetical protein